jgi:hypothetical protein
VADQIAADRQSLKAAMADLEADHSSALDIQSRNLTDSGVEVEEAVSKHCSALSATCNSLLRYYPDSVIFCNGVQ